MIDSATPQTISLKRLRELHADAEELEEAAMLWGWEDYLRMLDSLECELRSTLERRERKLAYGED